MQNTWLDRFLQNTWFGNLLDHYFGHDVARESAALAYYLFFTIFPILVFISNLIGFMDLDIAGIVTVLQTLLPQTAVDFIEAYLTYVTDNSNNTLLWFSLYFSVYFPFRATNTLMRDVRRAYHVKRPTTIIGFNLKVLIFTVLLLVTLTVGIAAAVAGRQVLAFINQYITLPSLLVELWLRLRFIVLAGLVWLLVALLYAFAPDERIPTAWILPGALVAMTSWIVVTLGFSFYVENFANYSLIYGSIGAVIVLLLWLYMTSLMMIMGAEYNAMRIERRARKEKRQRELAAAKTAAAAEAPRAAAGAAAPTETGRGKDRD